MTAAVRRRMEICKDILRDTNDRVILSEQKDTEGDTAVLSRYFSKSSHSLMFQEYGKHVHPVSLQQQQQVARHR